MTRTQRAEGGGGQSEDGLHPMHAAHVEMNHYYGAMDIAKALGDAMGGKGKVAILNAPPGIIIRDQRTNGFVDGLKQHHPGIEIVADQVADWHRKKAQDVLTTILAAHPDLGGVYGVNDSMALGAVDVAREKGLLGKIVIFGNDGETGALELAAGELTGTQYTDVYQQCRLAAAAATVLASGGVPAMAFVQQGHLLIPYVIVTKDNVDQVQPSQRWQKRGTGVSCPRRRHRPFLHSVPPESNDSTSLDRRAAHLLRSDIPDLLPICPAFRQRRQHGEPDVGLIVPGHPRDRAGVPDPGARHRSVDRGDRRARGMVTFDLSLIFGLPGYLVIPLALLDGDRGGGSQRRARRPARHLSS